jgi:GNAT superfamily N-acetyltransferase
MSPIECVCERLSLLVAHYPSKDLFLSKEMSSSSSSSSAHQPIQCKVWYEPEPVPTHVLEACAALFSTQYGVWSSLEEHQEQLSSFKAQPGQSVKMSAKRLAAMMLFDQTCGVVVAQTHDGTIVGHAFFATFHSSNERHIRWITQLVVDAACRERGIAVSLINIAMVDKQGMFAVGLVSSHPAAVRALETAAGVRCSAVYNQQYASDILSACTVPYLKIAKLASNSYTIDTSFLVDHTEVLRILAADVFRGKVEPTRAWQLGERLPEGHEFLALAILKPPSLLAVSPAKK